MREFFGGKNAHRRGMRITSGTRAQLWVIMLIVNHVILVPVTTVSQYKYVGFFFGGEGEFYEQFWRDVGMLTYKKYPMIQNFTRVLRHSPVAKFFRM